MSNNDKASDSTNHSTLHEHKSDTGVSRVRRTSNGEIVIDSYFGDVKDKDNHDRFTLNVTRGTVSGHGINHEGKFDTSKK